MSTIKEILLEHEWSWKDGNKLYCPSCGKEHRDTTKVRTHNKDCKFVKTIELLKLAHNSFGDNCLSWNI